MHAQSLRAYIVIAVFTLIPCSRAYSLLISAAHSIKLSTPVTEELADRMKMKTRDLFRAELLEWVAGNADIMLDTSNALDNYYFELLYKSCMNHIEEKTEMEGYTWIYTVELLPEYVFQAIKQLQTQYGDQLLATHVTAPQTDTVSVGEIESLAHLLQLCRGYVLFQPGDTVADICAKRKNHMENILRRLKFVSTEAVVAGTPGHTPTSAPAIKAAIDSTPVPGLPCIGRMPDGRMIFSAQTDSSGTISLSSLHIPYTAYGSVFEIHINLGGLIDPALNFTPADFRLAGARNIMLMFKTSPPTFKLEHHVEPRGGITVPGSFSDPAVLKGHLKKSLYFTPAQTGDSADVVFRITCHPERKVKMREGIVVLTVPASVTVRERSTGRSLTESRLLHEQIYDMDRSIATGLFFHESTRQLHALLAEMLNTF